MKKALLMLAMIVGVLSVSARDSYTHNVDVLPAAARTTVKNNFKAEISHIKVDKDFGRVSEYDVVLTDGSEITFDRNGNWKDVEVRRNASVPSAFVPSEIASYISKNQKKASVTGIEKKHSGYDVGLSNGVEMKFDSQGKFLRYDD